MKPNGQDQALDYGKKSILHTMCIQGLSLHAKRCVMVAKLSVAGKILVGAERVARASSVAERARAVAAKAFPRFRANDYYRRAMKRWLARLRELACCCHGIAPALSAAGSASGRTWVSRVTKVLPGSSQGTIWAERSNQMAFLNGALTFSSQAAVGSDGVV